MTCCEEEQRGTRPHAVDLSSASESGTSRGTYAGTGTQALRVVIAFGVDELTNPYDMSGIEVLEDKEKVLTVLKEMRTPVLLFCSHQKYFENIFFLPFQSLSSISKLRFLPC